MTDTVDLKVAALQATIEEQRRGMLVAADEREKAAQALRVELQRAITEGDRALRDHIEAQINQIREAQEAAERLALQRSATLEAQIRAVAAEATEHVEQLRRERELVTSAQMQAIAKAEAANEKRFEAANEWRGQSADRERTQQEQMAKLSGTFLPREVADAQWDQINERLRKVEQGQTMQAGATGAERRAQDRLQPWMLWVAGVVLAMFTTSVVVVTNVLTG